ncbi:translation initiation factor 1A / IF-1 [Nitzschia inconspicua]|uniref:Translation initiation factor 1A / IF-1 n=1 Tax=Nitzschia inconspicua TaxID=303405 RepID=A0A9K3PDH3_9STRA|nr:translation initiation factor 1A / IF-1 [Nitzschia inconspicua]KAG7343662.1 translation initiation factor 1A / IF-1 [Nitzschia inconspicua]
MAGLGRRTHYRKHLTDSVLWDTPEPRSDECIAKIVNTRGGNQFDVLLPISHNNNNNNNNVTQRPAPQLALLPTKFHKLVWVKRNDFVIVQIGMESTEERKDTVKAGHSDNAGINTDQNSNDSLVDIQENEASCVTSTATIERDTNYTPLSLSPTPETITAGTIGTNVDTNNADPSLGNGVRYMISHILYKDQIKHLKSKGLWPEDDPEFSDFNTPATATTVSTTATTKANGLDDGIVYNTNHYYNDNDDTIDNGNREEQGSEIDHDNDYYDDDNDDDHNNETDHYNSTDDMLLFVNTNRLARVEIQDSSTDSEDEDSKSEEEQEED